MDFKTLQRIAELERKVAELEAAIAQLLALRRPILHMPAQSRGNGGSH